MLDPTTETKRGNFGRYYPWSRTLAVHAWVGHGTMALKCVNLPPILLVGHCEAQTGHASPFPS
jgi:hypothetical protein